jgi:hypothetical protein
VRPDPTVQPLRADRHVGVPTIISRVVAQVQPTNVPGRPMAAQAIQKVTARPSAR